MKMQTHRLDVSGRSDPLPLEFFSLLEAEERTEKKKRERGHSVIMDATLLYLNSSYGDTRRAIVA